MLEIQNQEHFNKVVAFARESGRLEQLIDRLAYLDTYANHEEDRTKCMLGYDWAPYSFSFTMMVRNESGEYEPWFHGGLIFHGPHDGGGSGGAPTFSVCLTPTDGWSIHT